MHPLLVALSAWPGRPSTQSLLQAKGYWLPERYREIVLENCAGCDAAAVERYWDEVALEYFSCAGRVRPNRRKFGGETAYRSQYLDSLASLEANRDAASLGLPLDHGLQVFMAKRGGDFWQRIAQQMESYKRVEIESLGISAEGWSGTQGDFLTHLRNAAESKGFVFKRKRWRKNFGEALEFCCCVDEGMRTTWAFQLPLLFEITHRAAPDLFFLAPLADVLVPGYNYYHLHRSPESAILGMHAHVDLFDTIGELIVNQPRSGSGT